MESPRSGNEVDFRAPLSGTVQSSAQVQLGFQLSGEVAAVLVEEGEQVKAGQLLARLEDDLYQAQVYQAEGASQQAEAQLRLLQNGSRPQELTQARAAVASAEAALERITRDHERLSLLFAQGVVSRSELDALDMAKRQAEESVVQARQQLALSEEGPRLEQIDLAKGALQASSGGLEMARTQLAHTELRAPISGTVTMRMLEPGQNVLAGSPVIELADLSSLEIRTEIPEGDLAAISPGDMADVSFPASPADQTRATLVTIAPRASALTRAFPVTLVMSSAPEGIVPGMVALVTLGFSENPGGLVIRENAIIDDAVFVARDGRAVRIPVERLADRGGLVFVDGLSTDDQVIVNGQNRLAEGDDVVIVDALGISEITGLDNRSH
ncbi:efflux RND transporter periplasmic adaptor subunit [bacterium]|nr:efflux RND transporter periplasmic adaptor subunit [bacterium]